MGLGIQGVGEAGRMGHCNFSTPFRANFRIPDDPPGAARHFDR
jgi:hypothetical protein